MKSDTLNNKKEVSCKPLSSMFDYARNKGVDLTKILEGIPYDLAYLLNRHERIEWWVWCKIISNLRPYFNYSDFELMGKDFTKKEHYIEGYIFAFMFFSSGKIAKITKGVIIKAGKSILRPVFSCLNPEWEVIGENKFCLSIYLKPGYEHCPEWYYMTKGVWEELGNRAGLKGLKIELSIVSNGGHFVTSLEKEGFFTGLKKRFLWLFNIRRAFVDLTESHHELLNNYNKLEESKKLLQNQTTLLTTAYNISKSIRQNLDIAKTLNTITYSLVHDAGLSFSKIKLYKDVEGNACEIEASNGIIEVDGNPIKHPVVIENKKIGELTITPKIDSDLNELDELLNYLLPIINISIHDSLVLRAITDYKNNLEKKVGERTVELKNAQDKLSEIIQLQNRFFTNISHEFRTPLTLILGPSKQILEQTKNDKIKEEIKLIYRNANKLNILANQLLDISRIEAGRMKFRTTKLNIVPIIKRIIYTFQSFAERKRILLDFHSELEEIILYIDEDKIDKILSNILSNALKFTPNGGTINMNICINTNTVEITISDNGIGIPKDQIDKIFDRFYQVDNKLSKEYEGTGVGLSLTKELVELHKGKIFVDSEVGKGSTFKVMLPMGTAHLLPHEIVKKIRKEDETIEENKFKPLIPGLIDENILNEDNSLNQKRNIESFEKAEKPLLLIIEDNSDVRKYIIDILCNYYRIAEATNGEEGLYKSFEEIPDLIISDIMMPRMDGIKLCQSLKTDTRTSHIPIILLTAKATLNDKLEGLQAGADEYIMKPFEAEELKTRIKNLLAQRKRIHEHFQKFEIIIDEKKMTSLDQKFLQQTFALINHHLSDSDFTVEELATNLAVSRSLLHKKLVVLLGEPPREIIKRIRLNKAARLIEKKSGNIAEIAFEVGFSNPSYFAECFQKQFGFSPSQYHNNTINKI
jgi:signal transduction histidine kinase/DNA-binding response OmpR family regulator